MLGFTETVKQHLTSFQQRNKIECVFENHTSKLKLNSDQSVALFRIVQEALNNVAKHSRASRTKVVLEQVDDKLSLQINDNGIGFEQNANVHSDSYGLIGMRERVFLLDGVNLSKIFDKASDAQKTCQVSLLCSPCGPVRYEMIFVR